MSNGRVFFLNRYVYPDHSATSQLLSDVAFHLAGAGREVILVGSRQRYDDASVRLPTRERVEGVEIVRVGGTRFGRASLPGRALDYLSYLLGAARVLLGRVSQADTVVMMTDPPLLGTLLGPLARWRGARCLHWLQDLFPEVAEVLLGRSWHGWRIAPLRWLRNRSLRRADRVVVISAAMRNRVERCGVDLNRIALIENWTDDERIRPLAPAGNPLRGAWSLSGKFVVGYSGNLGRAHDWQTMFAVARALRHRDDICFLLVGDGRGMRQFAAAAAQEALPNVLMQPYQAREQLAVSLGVADLHWLSLLPGLDGLIFPSKLYGILAAGRPALLIGDPDDELASTLRDARAGWAIAVGDVQGGVALIERLAGDPVLVAASGSAARRHLEAGRLRRQALGRWSELLAST